MTWIAAIGSFLKSAFTAIPFFDKWFGDHSTVEDHIDDAKNQNAKDVADEQKKGRPGKPWFIFLFLLSECSNTTILPGEKIRYIIDTEGSRCAFPPMLRANTGEKDDVSALGAGGYYAHSPAVELMIRDALSSCQEKLRECRGK